MKKVAIVSLYKNSYNFGGLLQAKALTQAIETLGYQAVQINLGEFTNEFKSRSFIKKIEEHGIKYALELIKIKYKRFFKNKAVTENELKETKRLCKEFRNEINHTDIINEDDLQTLNSQYDIFITGSDQVWNPKWMRGVYLLDFVDKNKNRISYAASIARYDFSDYEKNMLYNGIKEFNWISVREKKAQIYIKEKFNINSDLILDPTLLLTKAEWEKEERNINIDYKYIFCYFLNPTKKKRRVALNIAKKYKYKIIYPMFVGIDYKYNDKVSGECVINEVGPREWLFLLHNSDAVITDSFHGTVFSIIYHKNFLHIFRDDIKKNVAMNSRVISLLEEFGLNTQIYSEENERINTINYGIVENILMEKRKESIELLSSKLSL